MRGTQRGVAQESGGKRERERKMEKERGREMNIDGGKEREGEKMREE